MVDHRMCLEASGCSDRLLTSALLMGQVPWLGYRRDWVMGCHSCGLGRVCGFWK